MSPAFRRLFADEARHGSPLERLRIESKSRLLVCLAASAAVEQANRLFYLITVNSIDLMLNKIVVIAHL